MIQTTFLHIGRHKCGTTSLQRSLLENRDSLLEQGIYYPLEGLEDTGHHPIARALEKQRSPMPWRRSGKQHKDRRTASGAELGKFLDGLVTSAAPIAVISSESFQNCKPSTVASFFNGFQVIPVVYLREQGAYLRSAYAQRVHASTYAETVHKFSRDYFQAN